MCFLFHISATFLYSPPIPVLLSSSPPLYFVAFLPPFLLSSPLRALMWRLNLTLLDDITVRCLLACLPAWGL